MAKKQQTMKFFRSVDSVDISVFLHFVDIFDKQNIHLSLKHILWSTLIENGTRSGRLTYEDGKTIVETTSADKLNFD